MLSRISTPLVSLSGEGWGEGRNLQRDREKTRYFKKINANFQAVNFVLSLRAEGLQAAIGLCAAVAEVGPGVAVGGGVVEVDGGGY